MLLCIVIEEVCINASFSKWGIFSTYFDGFFEIRIPSNSFDKEVILVFSAIGMETKELKIDKLTKEINIDLASDIDNLEGVVVGGAFAYRPNIFQRFLNLFRSKENKRY